MLLLLIVYGVFMLIETTVNKFHEKEYTDSAIRINHQINNIIEAKEKSTMAIALAYAHNSALKSFFKHNNKSETNRRKLQDFSKELKMDTSYKNVWIQLIDADGISLIRSWTDKSGDSLLNARLDIQQIYR